MSFHGIPTMYRGVRFRSRAEARWASVFDALSWPWAYEPIDLDGYVPDFLIEWATPLLVEVKGIGSIDDARDLAVSKIEASGWGGEALVVCSTIDDIGATNPRLGLHGERDMSPDGLGWLWDSARLFRCLNCGELSVLNEAGSWRCRACEAADGNAHVGAVDVPLGEIWNAAGNAVQWRKGA